MCHKIDVNVSTFEFACIKLCVNNSNLTLVCLYRPPQTSKGGFCSELENLLSCLPSEPNSVIVCGDYNIDVVDNAGHFNNIVAFHLLINAYPVIFLPTHTTQTSNTITDHVFCYFIHIASSGVINETISDHLPIFISVNLQTPESMPSKNSCYVSVRPLNRKGIASLRASLSGQDWSFITETSDINHDYEKLVSILTDKIEVFCLLSVYWFVVQMINLGLLGALDAVVSKKINCLS